MPRRHNEGIELDLPFFHFYAGERGIRLGGVGDEEEVIDMEGNDASEYRAVRRRVRARLRFFRHALTFLTVNGLFVLLDWWTGGAGSGVNWSKWVALVWGALLTWEFVSTFAAPVLWGPDVEERLIERELRRRRGA